MSLRMIWLCRAARSSALVLVRLWIIRTSPRATGSSVLVLVRLDHAQAASSVGWWNGAVGAARLWAAGPTAQPQHRAYLRGHAAWVTGHVTPAVPERGLAGQGRNVVAPHIPKGTVHRVGCPAIQLDDDTPRAVANVAVPPAPTGSRFTLIPSAAGSPWPCSTSRRYLRSSGEVIPSSTSDSTSSSRARHRCRGRRCRLNRNRSAVVRRRCVARSTRSTASDADAVSPTSTTAFSNRIRGGCAEGWRIDLTSASSSPRRRCTRSPGCGRTRRDSGTTTSRMGGGSSNTLHNHSAVPWLAAAP